METLLDSIAKKERTGLPAPVIKVLRDATSKARVGAACDMALSICEQVRSLCEERFLIYHFACVPAVWHELNTDVAILAACASLHANTGYADRIRQLDLATIVSGCARTAIVSDLIERLQERMNQQPTTSSKRRRTSPRDPELSLLSSAARSIPEIEVPTVSQFIEHCPKTGSLGVPFILRGYAKTWRALTPERSGRPPRWADPVYLRRRAGPGRVVPVETGARYTDADWGQEIMGWDEFLDAAGWDESEPRSVYLAQHPLLYQFPWLAEDISMPPFVNANPPEPEYAPEYKAPAEPLANVWIGPRGTVSPAHTDAYYNCYVQVVGHKEVWLAPPNVRDRMNVCRHNDCEHPMQGLMDNTSRIDVFKVMPDSLRVAAHAQHAILAPGDMLFFPPLWWHAMRAIDKVRLC